MSFKRSTQSNIDRRIVRLDNKLEKAQAQIRKLQSLRLWTGALTVVGFLLAALQPALNLGFPTLVFFLLVFPFLVRASRQWVKFRNCLQTWRDFESRQQSRRLGHWRSELINTKGLPVDSLGLANDLDLQGPKSLFTQIDETFSEGGASRLFSWMLADSVRETIEIRQKLLKELSVSRWFFLRFRISNPSRSEAQFSSTSLLDQISKFPASSLKLLALLTLVIVSWVASVALVIHYPWIWALFFIAHFGYLLRAGPLMSRGEGVLHHFSDLAPSFAALEASRAPNSIQQMCKVIRTEKPARRIQRFNWTLVGLSIESHPLVYLGVNFFLPWSAIFSFILINQVDGVRKCLRECFAELEEIEALTSLVILTTDQTEVFPTLLQKTMIKGQKLFHPLIDQEKRVANDFAFKPNEKMILLTGSNMSGKSTFLRTLGLSQVLANMGAPVFAESFETYPFRMRSCIRVSDSIEQGFSYFYAEVQRLKTVLDHASQEPPVLYLIDEIFRGTNNRERLIGSQSVIRHLLTTPAYGFITTHDLELTQIAEGNSQVRNCHFKDEARDGVMYFSYRLEDGPSPTTNALKIMQQAGLPVQAT